MFLREAPTTTLADVADEWSRSTGAYWGGPLANVDFALTADTPSIRLGEHEVRATPEGILHLGGFLGIPAPYLKKLPADMQQYLLSEHVNRAAEDNISITYTTDGGVTDVVKSGTQRLLAAQVAEIALDAMPEDSMVTDHWITPQDLRLDVVVPEGFGRGWVTDGETGEYDWRGERKVGDITGGGLRFVQNRKQNLSVEIQKFLYRLACTNGYEVEKVTGKMDARGMGVDEMIHYMEAEARRLFGEVENDIRAFYDLRNQPLSEDRTGDLRRLAQEAGLPTRTVGRLEDLLPEHLGEDPSGASMFDVANLMTNLANNASVRGSAARTLQQVGGNLITDHAARCAACHHRL